MTHIEIQDRTERRNTRCLVTPATQADLVNAWFCEARARRRQAPEIWSRSSQLVLFLRHTWLLVENGFAACIALTTLFHLDKVRNDLEWAMYVASSCHTWLLVANGCATCIALTTLFHLDKVRNDLEWAKYVASSCLEREYNFTHWPQFCKEYSTHRRNFSWVTYTFIALCLLVHVYRRGSCGKEERDAMECDWIRNALHVQSTPDGEFFYFYQMAASTFLHVSMTHLLCNTLALWVIGSNLERLHGSMITGLILFFSTIGGTLTFRVVTGPILSVGASGAVYGLRCAIYADLWTNWDLVTATGDDDTVWNRSTMLKWLAVGFFLEVTWSALTELVVGSRTAHWAHIGGVLAGFSLSLPFLRFSRGYNQFVRGENDGKRQGRSYKKFLWLQRVVFSVGVFLFLFMAVRVWSFNGSPPGYCPGCLKRPSSWKVYNGKTWVQLVRIRFHRSSNISQNGIS